jgi:hypothetical protein
LQKSNPDLLLTANELKHFQRDVQYVPACSSALLSIITKANSLNSSLLGCVNQWENTNRKGQKLGQVETKSKEDDFTRERLGTLMENRFRSVLANKGKKSRGKVEVNNDSKCRSLGLSGMNSDTCKVLDSLVHSEASTRGDDDSSNGDSDGDLKSLGAIAIPFHDSIATENQCEEDFYDNW